MQKKKESSPRWGPGSRLGVIGGLGEMGRLFGRFFGMQGYDVQAADIGTAVGNIELVENSDIVLFAVPLHKTAALIRETVPHTRSDQLLIDISSLKVASTNEMLRSPASVLGLHPMFGGNIASFKGQNLLACPMRIGADEWHCFRELFQTQGMHVRTLSPDAHDRMMSVVQVLFHVTTMLTGGVLRDLRINIMEALEYASPSTNLAATIMGRIFAQNRELYAAITQMNPYSNEIIGRLRQGLASYEKWHADQDLERFCEDFAQSAEHLGAFCEKAYQESALLFDFAAGPDSDRRQTLSHG